MRWYTKNATRECQLDVTTNHREKGSAGNKSGGVRASKEFDLGPRLIRTDVKGKRQLLLFAYYGGVAALGLWAGVLTLKNRPLPTTGTVALLLGLGIAAYRSPVEFPFGIKMNAGFPLLAGALYSHGSPGNLLVTVPSTLLQAILGEHATINCLFNAGQFTFCAIAAETVGFLAGWEPGIPATSHTFFPIVLMLLTSDVVNNLFLSVSVVIQTNRTFKDSFWSLFYEHRKSVIPFRAFLAIVAMLLSSYMGNIAFVLVLAGVIALRSQNVVQRELLQRTREAETDSLTQTYNIRFLNRWMRTVFRKHARQNDPCSFIFVDCDDLKRVNDNYGHNAGDQALIYLANILSKNIRGEDHLVRYGGDEFIVVCPQTNMEQCTAAARRIVGVLAENPFLYEGTQVNFRISVGVASWPDHGDTCSDVIRKADKAMYLAKKSGGNTVRTAENL